LKAVFAKLKVMAAYSSVDMFMEALDKWVEEFEVPSTATKLNPNQQILYLGM
jgi:hypothetical protein